MSNLLKKVNDLSLIGLMGEQKHNVLQRDNIIEFNCGLSQQLALHVAEYFFKTEEQITYDFYVKLVDQLQAIQASLNEEIV